MTIKQPLASLLLSALTALGATACAPGIDVGQATGTGSSSSSGGTTTGGVPDSGSVNASFLDINPNPVDFGTVVVNTTATQTITVTNTSSAPVRGISASVSGPFNWRFEVLDMPTTLAAFASATVDIQFSPLQASPSFEASIAVSAPGFESVTVALQATALEGAIEIGTTPLEFGYVVLLSTVVECSPLTNQANVAVTITGVNSFESAGGCFALATTDDSNPPNPFSLPITIAPGGTGKVCFSLTPPITQQYDGHASLMTDDPSGINPIIQLSGWGGGPQISCTPVNLTFDPADVGLGPLPVTCTNTGTALPATYLVFGAVTTTSPLFSAQLQLEPGAVGLAPGQSTTIDVDVAYQPLTDGGSTGTGTLIINSNGGQGLPVMIPLAVHGS